MWMSSIEPTRQSKRRSDDGPGEYRTAPRETNQGHPRSPEVYSIHPRFELQSPDGTLGEPPVTDSPAAHPQTADQPMSVLGSCKFLSGVGIAGVV